MADVSYAKLWKKMEEKGLMKSELCREAKITTNAMAKLGRNDDVRVNILVKLCRYFNCTVDEIMDVLPAEDIDK